MCEWLEKDGSCDLNGLNELFLQMDNLSDGSSSIYKDHSK